MIKLIKNEFIKIFKRSKTWIIFCLFIAFIMITAFGTWKNDKDIREWMSPENQLAQLEEQLKYIQEDISRAEKENNSEWINSSKDIEKSLLNDIERQKDIIKNGINETAWKEELESNIENLEAQIKQYEEEGINEWNKYWYAQSKKNLEDYKYLLENNISPIESWEYNESSFFKNLSSFFGLGLLVAGISVFMSDIVSGEYTPATLKFLLVQPVKRGKILLSKYIVSIFTVIFLIIIPQIIGIFLVNINSNIEVSDYPIRIEQKYEKIYDYDSQEMVLEEIPDTSKVITTNKFIVKSLLYQILFIVSACSIIFMFSTLFKNSMISMAISVILTIFLSIGSQAITTMKGISHLIFTTYSDTANLLTSDLALSYQNTNLTTENAIICMLITSILAYIIAHINFTKKDILI